MVSDLDNLLSEIAELSGKEMQNKRNEYARKIIQFQNLSNSNFSSQILFASTNTPQQKQFVAACLLRLLCRNENAIWDDLDFRNKTFNIFDEQLSEIYPSLKIGERTETHEKLSHLKDIERKMLEEFNVIVSNLTSLKLAVEYRNNIMKTLKKPINKFFLYNFIDAPLLSGERLDELFEALKSYEETSGVARMEVFQDVNNIFSMYIHDVDQCHSEFASLCLRSAFKKIHSLICDDFGKSDIIKPANVKLLHPDRKYPFYKINERIELKLVLKNEGLGYAFDVEIEVVDADGLTTEFNQTVATEMKIESINIILPVVVSRTKTANPSLLIHYSWRNYDNREGFEEELFEFESQKEDIDWDGLKFRRPYSLQAVETEEELVGRKELVANIYANLISDTIQSVMIFGQKRVGKTSIAKAIANKIQKEIDFVPIFVKVGDLDKTSPRNFIKTLGEAIVEETQYHNQLSKSGIDKPVFDEVLSPPLATYFKRIKRLFSKLKFIIIIDEFDEIPSELYRYTDIGNTFFHNIRSLSQEGTQIGFILIGGENMQIIRESTDRLNLFHPVQVDYFDKERFFGDFKELIRYPVQDILEFSDGSIDEIYRLTEGNPFFTKFVCDKLFKQACDKKDSYISIDEAKEAIASSIESLDTINVNHFWIDGIWEEQCERRDQTQTQRRKFLIAYAEIKRCSGRVRRQEILKSRILTDVATEAMIENFINRGILLDDEGDFRLKPELFDEWLVQRGSQLLTSSLSDANALEELKSKEDKAFVTDREIIGLTKNWDLYRSTEITPSHVRAWLDQFSDNLERRLMFKLLENVTFYSEIKIREKLRIIHKFTKKDITFSIKEDQRRSREVLLSSFDNPAKSSSSYARMYAAENKVISSHVASLEDIPKSLDQDHEKRISAIVFIDDIIASGGSIIDGIEKLNLICGKTIEGRNIKVVIATICGLESGREAIERTVESKIPFKVEIYICDTLDDSNRCFTDNSLVFDDEGERRRAKEIAHKYGVKLQKKGPLGFDGGQLLVVFKDTCPNNSLPILWCHVESSWTPLFRRH
ncbi:ATP-binding protein [Microcoleus sp. B5-D4]|uniref:phosphoribosyltransferase-like protein n=1 Tax=unclassified Microcoleus TaxID=2642155 RepID=UPI002FD44F76